MVISVAEDAIYRWAQRWNEERSVEDRDRSGRPPALGEKEKKEIKRLPDWNEHGKHGINPSTWTCTEPRLYFLRKGVTVSEETVRRCLRDMGAHYVKATLEYAETYSREVASERDEFAVSFISDMNAKPDDAVLLFEYQTSIDSSHNGATTASALSALSKAVSTG
jgi:transposase